MADNDENNVGEKHVARKKSLPEKIFEWIGLIVVLLLIVALMVLRTPWTMISVLIAIVLVETFVPKLVKKRIWLTVASIVIAFIVWVFLPDDTEGWRPYTFDKELVAMEAKRSVSTEDNAAAIYNQLLESYDPNSFDKDFLSWDNKDLILLAFWKSKDYPEVASWLQTHQQIIDQLMLACKKNECRFPIAGNLSATELKPPSNFKDVTGFWWSSYERLAPMRRLAELLIISANNDIAEGRIDQAIEKYITTLQMAKHLYQQPAPMDLLVGIAINLQGLDQINKYVVTGDANNEHLQLLDNTLQSIQYGWRSDLHQILDYEKLMFKSFMCAMFYQTNQEGRIRLNRDPESALSSQMHIQYTVSGRSRLSFIPPKPGNYWRIKFTKAKAVFCWFFTPSTPQEAAMIIDDIHKQYHAMAESEFDWNKEPKQFSMMTVRLNFRYLMEIMSRLSEDDWPIIHDRYLKATAWKRASRLIIALRNHKNRTGHWPQRLEEVRPLVTAEIFVDPISNSSFVYKSAEENFVLYSKGKNGIDEDGKRDYSGGYIQLRPNLSGPIRNERVDPDDILIWPPENRR
jgi:hypothetical protein